MEIVIDIPEMLYEKIQNRKADKRTLETVILRGKVLPEHHGDLVDRDELLDNSYEISSMYCLYDEVVNVDDIKDAPTIIEGSEKRTCGNCLLDGTDACSRGAGRAVDDSVCEDFI